MHFISGWLKPVAGEVQRAFCTACHCQLQAKKKTLLDHGKSSKHKKSIVLRKNFVRDISPFLATPVEKAIKIAELKLAAHIAEHSAFSTCDHLGELICHLDVTASNLAKMKIHRTKCSLLITNAIAPNLHREVLDDIMSSDGYSLIIDESTDIATKKCLAIMIIYFSKAKCELVSTFFDMVELEDGTANGIVSAVKNTVRKNQLDLQKMFGLGIDGTNTMIGEHHSVAKLMKDEIPHLIVVRCICHSLHLAASTASEVLPRHLDFLVRETYGWFSHSTKRQLAYAKLYQVINGKGPKKITRSCDTRWLSREDAISRIITQWDELLLHFSMARTQEKCYTAEQLYLMFKDPMNRLYLQFVQKQLCYVVKVNCLFQAENADVCKLITSLVQLYRSILQSIVVPMR